MKRLLSYILLMLMMATSVVIGQWNEWGRRPDWAHLMRHLVPQDNLALFVNPAAQMIDNAQGNAQYPALKLGQEMGENYDFHDFTIDYPSIGEASPFYESDFSVDEDGWTADYGVVSAPETEPVTGETNVLKFYASADNNIHRARYNLTKQIGQKYKLTGKVYIPSTNTNVDGIYIAYSGYSDGGVLWITTLDTWVDFEVELTRLERYTWDAITLYAMKSNASNFTGAGSSSDDIFYVKDVKVQRVGLVAWWQFDSYYHSNEATGKTILQDLSGNGHDLTASAGFDYTNQMTGDDPVYKNGNSLEFDGVDDRFSNEGSAFQPGNGNFSALVWFKTSEPAGTHHVLAETYDGAGANWQLMIEPSIGKLRATVTDGTNSQTLLGNPVNDNNWHLGVLVRDGSTFYLYDNATVVASWTGTMGSLSNTNELSIGMRNGGTLGFVGDIITVAYFNRALSSTEIQALYGKPKNWTWNETGSITNNNFKAVLSGGAELSQDITVDDETLYKEQKISTTSNEVDYFGNTTSHTITIGDGTWTYAGVKDVTNVDAVGSNFVEDFSKGGAVYSDELVTNGNMESDSDWLNVGTPDTNEQSTEQVYAGSYSRKVVVSTSDYYGIQQNIATVANSLYVVDAYIYVVSGSVRIELQYGDNERVTTTGSWQHVRFYTYTTVDNDYIMIRSAGVPATFYVDNVSIKKVSNGNHGLAQGDLELSQPVFPYGWEFDGVDDYIDFSSIGSMDWYNNDWIICFWANPTQTQNETVVAGESPNRFQIRFDPLYTAPRLIMGDGTTTITKGYPVNLSNKWHFYSIVFKANTKTAEFYVDADLKISYNDYSALTKCSTDNFYIGKHVSEYMKGKIAPVTIYPFDGQNGRLSTMPSNYYQRYIQKIYNNTRRYFQ